MVKQKCSKCKKKLTLGQISMGECLLCNATYCHRHRLPEDHECEYTDKVKLSLPKCIPAKVEKL